MDAFAGGAEVVYFMKPTQVGATEVIGNLLGYHIDQDPAPVLVVLPNLTLAEAWSNDRLAPMIRDSPALAARVAPAKGRDAGNTILHKFFPRGHVTIGGANSPAGLASRPIRVLLCDERDRWGVSAGREGNPFDLVLRRTDNFWNRRIFVASSPTTKGRSPIEDGFKSSDQRRYFVPCPACGHMQTLKWSRETVIFLPVDRDGASGGLGYDPDGTLYRCEGCAQTFDLDAHKARMLQAGAWRATSPGPGKPVGFHLNGLYSPWVPLSRIVREFLDATAKSRRGDHESLKTWVNTRLGETFEVEGESLDEGPLMARRERYAAPLPAGVAILMAGVDLQGDRIEVDVWGFGPGEESWEIDWQAIYGNPAQAQVWDQLDDYLARTFLHELGVELPIFAVGMDTGGHHTQQAYAFCKTRGGRRVYALKGVGTPGAPLVGRPSKRNLGGINLYPVGTDTVKDLIHARLSIHTPGPGYMHFPEDRDPEYFRQLTAEQRITRFVHGHPTERWERKQPGGRNEVLDMTGYALAALKIVNPNLDACAQRIREEATSRQTGIAPRAVPGRRRQISKGL